MYVKFDRAVMLVAIEIGTLFVGVVAGERIENNRFEVAKQFAIVQAEDALDAERVAKAMGLLFVANTSERIPRTIDLLLGRAYAAKGMDCLATDFIDSYRRHVVSNHLANLLETSYQEIARLLATTSEHFVRLGKPM